MFRDIKTVLVTGGAGFIGSALVRKLLKETNLMIFNIDKMGYASSINSVEKNSDEEINIKASLRHKLIKLDLLERKKLIKTIDEVDPDLVIHFAAESHVDRSIRSPDTFVESNIIGTFNLLESVRMHFEKMQNDRKSSFKFHHISTDEVYGSLESSGFFNENSIYDPRSPYSASKAASDHLVNAWHHTYGIPTITTNCSNNYGPWQYPEKLIPLTIYKILNRDNIPIYGDGKNVRDWLFVDDHIDAILLAIERGKNGKKYCIGGYGEKSNLEVVHSICNLMDKKTNLNQSSLELITFVKDRAGHDKRYAIDSTLITEELGWHPKYNFNEGLEKTIDWYLENKKWLYTVFQNNKN